MNYTGLMNSNVSSSLLISLRMKFYCYYLINTVSQTLTSFQLYKVRKKTSKQILLNAIQYAKVTNWHSQATSSRQTIHPESIAKILNLNILHKKSRFLTSFKKKSIDLETLGPLLEKLSSCLDFPLDHFPPHFLLLT